MVVKHAFSKDKALDVYMKPLSTAFKSLALSGGQESSDITKWNLQGKIFDCHALLLAESGFDKKYQVTRYVSCNTSYIYQIIEKTALTKRAIKVYNEEDTPGLFKKDCSMLQQVVGEPTAVNMLESYDFGPTKVIVLPWAAGDMRHKSRIFKNITTDVQFRILARQLLDAIDMLDRKNINHSRIGVFDLLYFQEEGRVKLSAFERAELEESACNYKALEIVLEALKKIQPQIRDLTDTSQSLLTLMAEVTLPKVTQTALYEANLLVLLDSPPYSDMSDYDERWDKASEASKSMKAEVMAAEALRPKPSAKDLLRHPAVSSILPDTRLDL